MSKIYNCEWCGDLEHEIIEDISALTMVCADYDLPIFNKKDGKLTKEPNFTLIYHSDYELWEIHYPDGGGLDAIEPEEFEELMIKTNNGEINVFKLLNDKCLYKMSDCDHYWFNQLDWKWE